VDEFNVAGLEVEQVEPALQRHYRAGAVLAQRHGADLLRHIPSPEFPPIFGRTEYAPIEAVDPIESLLVCVP